MTIRVASALAAGSPQAAADLLLRDLRAQLGADEPELVLVFASTQQPLDELMPRLCAAWPRAATLGASTAGELTERGDAKGSVAVLAVAGDLRVAAGLATGLRADLEGTVRRAVEPLPEAPPGFEHVTALVLVDPLAGNAEEATLLAATMLGDGTRMAGGAAGDDLAMRATQVACGQTVRSDAIAIARVFSRDPIGLGIAHGHRAISRPLEVTRAEGNVVYEIEGRPAWSVWCEHTRESAKAIGIDPAALAPDEVPPYLLRYEAGLSTGSGTKIRAPLSRGDDGSLAFACGVPAGVVVRITESEPARQIESAREAARQARAGLGGRSVAGALVFDCICRKLILGDEFGSCVRGISEELGGAPLAGFETYGEIAFDVGDMSGFHNTTTVVLAFPA